MKYLSSCLILLAVLICGCILSACQISTVVVKTEEFLCSAYTSIENRQISQCKSSIQAASEHWGKHDHALGLLIHQDELGHVREELAGLRASIEAGDEDDFKNSCARLISNLRHLRKMQWPYSFHTL